MICNIHTFTNYNVTPILPAITNFILRVKYYKNTMEEIPSTECVVTHEVFLSCSTCFFTFGLSL
jgi:hypothetical protein